MILIFILSLRKNKNSPIGIISIALILLVFLVSNCPFQGQLSVVVPKYVELIFQKGETPRKKSEKILPVVKYGNQDIEICESNIK